MSEKTLLSITKKIIGLPDYLRDASLEALRNEWERKNNLVKLILAGEITFEQIVLPLVMENKKVSFWGYKKGICNSPEFKMMAISTVDELREIISFGDGFRILKEKTELKDHIMLSLQFIWSVIFSALILTLLFKEFTLQIFYGKGIIFPSSFLTIGYLIIGIFFSLMVLDGYRAWLESKKKRAQELLESAKLLDEIIKR
jgi:hypothetical protein